MPPSPRLTSTAPHRSPGIPGFGLKLACRAGISHETAEPRTTAHVEGFSHPMGTCTEVLGGVCKVCHVNIPSSEAETPTSVTQECTLPVGATLGSVPVCGDTSATKPLSQRPSIINMGHIRRILAGQTSLSVHYSPPPLHIGRSAFLDLG